MTPQEEQAKSYLDRAIQLIGEDKVGELLSDIASEAIQIAVSRLHGDPWWSDVLKQAIVSPMQFNTQLLCKLVDKAIPTPQSIKVGLEEGFKLVIEHTLPEGFSQPILTDISTPVAPLDTSLLSGPLDRPTQTTSRNGTDNPVSAPPKKPRVKKSR